MATFEIDAGKDGRFEVDAPDMDTALKALGMSPPAQQPAAEQKLGGPPPTAEKGFLVSRNAEGGLEPGEAIKPIWEGIKGLMQSGYQPRPTQPISSEQQMPDVQGIQNAAEAAKIATMGMNPTPGILGSLERQAAIRAGVEAERAFGPATQPAFPQGPQPLIPPAAPPPVPPNTAAMTQQFGPPAVRPTSEAPTTGPNPLPAPTARDQLIQAGNRQGVEVPRYMASESRIPKAIAGGLSGTPALGDPIVEATQSMAEGLGNRMEDIAHGIVPNATSDQSAGAAARRGMLNWIRQTSADLMSRGYDALDQLIDNKAMVPLSETRRFAGELTARDIESATPDGRNVVNLVRQALQRPRGLTYDGLKELRTRIGDRLSGDIVEVGTSQKMMRGLYGALTRDLRFAAGRAGVGQGGRDAAIQAFDEANAAAERIFGQREDLADIIGMQGDARPADVYNRIMGLASGGSRGDVERLALVRQTMGDAAWNEVRATMLRRMGLDKHDVFSPTRFNTEYGSKRLSDPAKDILFGDVRRHLDDIHALSQMWEDGARWGNPSGTGRSVAVTGFLLSLYMHPLAAIGELVSGHVLASALARPATAAATANYMRAYTQAAATPSPATRLLTLQAGQRLLDSIGARVSGPSLELLLPRKKEGAEAPQINRIEDAVRLPPKAEFIDPNGVRRRNVLKAGGVNARR